MPNPAPAPGPLSSPATAGVVSSPASSDAARDKQPRAILLMCLVAFVFAVQDGLSRHLGAAYSPMFVVMLRYWFMAAFVIILALRKPGGLRAAARSKRPVLQILRGVLLITETLLIVTAFVRLGLINTHAVFACSPLIVVALSGRLLGEKIGWRRWVAVGVGFIGILIVLKPTSGVFAADSLIPFLAAAMFGIYSLLTRMVSLEDPSGVSFFWTGIAGAVTSTAIGIAWIEPIHLYDVPLLLALCALGALSHFLLIKAYEMAEASSLQPFAYTQLVWVSFIGVLLLGETLAPNVAVGATIVVGAGLFTWWRTLQKSRQG
ncbi:DMT family transporter [Paracoccus aminophilus]|uniref:S-adenosylmethionine uptake transporter n=1 Tax=Paracoccus aminophilus JCM 7686 TaxID=1367847 RepID=S5XRB8_PARAH|nr:DMT family transporter [Paracoccus aminophilus]AGT07602.1 S-adenosylmethionine uptake transporter [Paracoccus aminophilus JCM 7686]